MCSEACAQLASGHRRGGGGVLLTLHELGQLKVFGRLPLRERLLSIRLRTGRRRCSAKNVYPSLWQNIGRCTPRGGCLAAFCHECIENLLAFCGHPHHDLISPLTCASTQHHELMGDPPETETSQSSELRAQRAERGACDLVQPLAAVTLSRRVISCSSRHQRTTRSPPHRAPLQARSRRRCPASAFLRRRLRT